jgi:hypothetical protein
MPIASRRQVGMSNLSHSRFAALLYGPDPRFVAVVVASALGGWVALPTQQGIVALAVLVLVGSVAIVNRPPARDATGRPVRPTLIVNALLGVGLSAIPLAFAVAGVTGGRTAAPIVVGIAIALFGSLAFALYSFIWIAIQRATPAGALAITTAGFVSIALTLPRLLDQLAGRNPF